MLSGYGWLFSIDHHAWPGILVEMHGGASEPQPSREGEEVYCDSCGQGAHMKNPTKSFQTLPNPPTTTTTNYYTTTITITTPTK